MFEILILAALVGPCEPAACAPAATVKVDVCVCERKKPIRKLLQKAMSAKLSLAVAKTCHMGGKAGLRCRPTCKVVVKVACKD